MGLFLSSIVHGFDFSSLRNPTAWPRPGDEPSNPPIDSARKQSRAFWQALAQKLWSQTRPY